jgi:hypothetical protein
MPKQLEKGLGLENKWVRGSRQSPKSRVSTDNGKPDCEITVLLSIGHKPVAASYERLAFCQKGKTCRRISPPVSVSVEGDPVQSATMEI